VYKNTLNIKSSLARQLAMYATFSAASTNVQQG